MIYIYLDLFVSADLFLSFAPVTWFKFISSLQLPVNKLFWRKRRHADKSGLTQLIIQFTLLLILLFINNDSHTTLLIIVHKSLSSCNLKCEIDYIIPISSDGNQTLLRTRLCRTQVPFLQLVLRGLFLICPISLY